jgi:MFS family permease
MGGMASLLLVFFRILQGLSFGAELPGAITVACEYSEKNKRGGNSGIVIASTSIGAMVASLILFVLTGVMTTGQILNWGWRIPFLLGGILAVANYFIRKHLQETPEFIEAQKFMPLKKDFRVPLFYLLKQYRIELLQGIGMTVFLSSLVIQVLYFPTFLKAHFGYSSSDIYLAMLCSMIWSALTLPLCGLLADSLGKRELFKRTTLVYIAGVFPLFSVLDLHTFSSLLFFMCMYQTVISFASVCYFPLLVEIFPTKIRYTGVAACYNITYSLMATLPLLLTALIRYSETPLSLVWVAIICAVVTCIALVFNQPVHAVPVNDV